MGSNPSVQSSTTAVKTTWVVCCTPTVGEPFCEYVEGTKLVDDAAAGGLTILDGSHVVRSYTTGAWSNFAEWVTNTMDYFSANVIRWGANEESPIEAPRTGHDPQRLPSPLGMDSNDLPHLPRRSLTRSRLTSASDGAVRTPTRLPGPRHA